MVKGVIGVFVLLDMITSSLSELVGKLKSIVGKMVCLTGNRGNSNDAALPDRACVPFEVHGLFSSIENHCELFKATKPARGIAFIQQYCHFTVVVESL